jgi:hypothetical protein
MLDRISNILGRLSKPRYLYYDSTKNEYWKQLITPDMLYTYLRVKQNRIGFWVSDNRITTSRYPLQSFWEQI